MNKLLLLFTFFFITITTSQAHLKNGTIPSIPAIKELETPWKLEKEENGIKIYTRHIDGWSIKEYKAILYIKAPLLAVENALRDTPNQTKWSQNTIMAKEIKNISKNDFYTYSQSNSPWPASDRDNVVHIKYSYPSKKSVQININSEPNFIPQKDGYVRVAKMKGFWLLEEVEGGLVKLTQQAAVDPGGSAPDWLINSFLVDGPLKMLKSFHDYVIANASLLIKQ